MYRMKKINEGSWVSHFIVPSTGNSSSAATNVKACELESSDYGKSSQQVFSQRVVSKNSDPRSFMIVTKSLLFNDMVPVFFDPELDPPNKACFNCWQSSDRGNYKNKHLHFACPEPKQREFCENCGRQGVDVSNCPRCARGYREYEKRGFRGKYASSGRKFGDVSERGRKERDRKELELQDDGFVFGYRDYKREIGEQDKGRSNFGADDQNFVGNARRDGFLTSDKDEASDKVVDVEDEDFDDIIVDEDERSETSSSTNDTVREFLSVMDQIKILSIEDQNDVILKFAKRRRDENASI